MQKTVIVTRIQRATYVIEVPAPSTVYPVLTIQDAVDQVMKDADFETDPDSYEVEEVG